MRKEWKIKKFSEKSLDLAKKYSLHPITIQLLLNRNIKEEDFSSFLNPQMRNLFSPFLLPDMDKAVYRIKEALEKKEKIVLFGDYDVDGITSLLIFYDYLKDSSFSFSFYIPHRLEEGYGLNKEAIKKIKKEKASLLICFDCGTNAYEEIEEAYNLGIDTIVIDHHTPKKNLNLAYAFVNPKRSDSSYPFKDLSSAALTFKLVWALKEKIPLHLLDLVALSIVCDVVPLKGENRILLKEGIKWLRSGHREEIELLCRSARLNLQNLTPYHIGYILGPRLNACGRISSALKVLNFFLTKDKNEKKNLAYQLEEYNQQRRKIEIEVTEEAEAMVNEEDFVHVLYKERWHPGVLGIVASRIAEKYWRPTFVVGINQMIGRGSARSIPQVNLVEVLSLCQKYLITYGGHRKACGFKIYESNLEAFKEEINSIVKDKLNGVFPRPFWEIDMKIKFKNLNFKLLEEIKKLEPFGEENNLPLFLTQKVFLKSSPKKEGGKYQLWVSDNELTMEAVIYDKELIDFVNYNSSLDIIYSLEKSFYPNQIRLVIKDIRLS